MPGVEAAHATTTTTTEPQPVDTLTVLPHVLRNVQLPWRTLCALLCTSNAVSAIVDSSCAGTMHLQLTKRVAKLLKWLCKHAGLLQTLQDERSDAAAKPEVTVALAVALSKAAALPGGLMLRALKTSSLPVLKAAGSSSSFLTVVQLDLTEEQLFPNTTAAVNGLKALGGQLQGLRLEAWLTLFDAARYLDNASWQSTSTVDEAKAARIKAVQLLVEGGEGGKGGKEGSSAVAGASSSSKSKGTSAEADAPTCGLAGLLRQALPHLTALTRLEVETVPDACVFKYAPPQLRELVAVGVDDQSERPLELGHLTALTMMDWGRNPEYECEGWRVLIDKDTLPPNLVKLSVVDAFSTSPLLPLTQLQELSICAHCHLTAPELKRLSVLTQLQSVRLGYCVYRGGFADRQAQEDCEGWSSVPALAELELHHMWIDPASDLLKHLAGLTTLTRLVWDETFLVPDQHIDAIYAAAMAGQPVPQLPPIVTYRDGGLSAFGAALPTSLRRLELSTFIPEAQEGGAGGGGGGASDDDDGGGAIALGGPQGGPSEADVVMGLQNFAESVIALPQLESVVVMESDTSLFSQEGQEVIEMILNGMCGGAGEYDADEVFSAFCDAYPGFFEDSEGSGEEEEEEGSGEEDEAGEGEEGGESAQAASGEAE